MIAAVLVASGWRPVRRWIEGRTRQLGARRGPATGRSLDSFGEQLSRAIPMDELLLQLAEALSHSLRLARAEVWSGSGELMRRTASVPHRELAELRLTPEEARVIARAGVSSRAWAKVWLPTLIAVSEGRDQRVAPLAHGDELLGLIVVERDRIEGAFRGDEERVLGEVARRMGLALHNVALDSALQVSLSELRDQARELRDSRKRVVTAADGERRRIERDLHDGAQQRLIGLNLKVGLMRRVSDARETPESLLDDLDREVHDALDELRRLAHGIYPPLLADGGLSAALAEAARRSPIPAHLHADELGRFHPDAEAAVYFCCLEALQNAAKHAGEGATATVRVWGEQDALLFEVADDGAGFGDEPLRPGAGLHNMTDRVGALGGSLDVRSRPERAGTEIRGRIPLAPGEHRIGEHERGRPAPAL